MVMLDCVIVNTYVNVTMYYRYLGFDVLVYHKENMNNTEGSMFPSSSLSIASTWNKTSSVLPLD